MRSFSLFTADNGAVLFVLSIYGGIAISYIRLIFLLPAVFIAILLGPLLCPAGNADTGLKAADLVAENQPINVSSPGYEQLFQELEERYHFSRKDLQPLFTGLQADRTVLELMDRQGEARPYYQYRPLFITPLGVAKGKESLRQYRLLFDRIEAEFGVDRQYIVAIWGIESSFGFNQGGFNLFRTLNTLFAMYPRRSDFFRKELINFLLLCRNNGIDPRSINGSYAGAFGQAQFMPSSFNEYAVDFDGDSRRDLIHSMADVFASIANYLKNFGWTMHAPVYAEIGTALLSDRLMNTYKEGRKGLIEWRTIADTQKIILPHPPQNGKLSIVGLEQSPKEGGGMRFVAGYPNFQAITAYNQSNKYAMAVSELAEAFKN